MKNTIVNRGTAAALCFLMCFISIPVMPAHAMVTQKPLVFGTSSKGSQQSGVPADKVDTTAKQEVPVEPNAGFMNPSAIRAATVNTPSTTMTPSIDTQKPSVPTGLAVSNVTATGVKLSWNAVTDNAGGSGVTGYDIYKDSALFATVAGNVTTYTVTGLTEGTAYTFTIKAKDAANNVSDASDPLSVTPSSVNQPPVATAPTVNPFNEDTPQAITLGGTDPDHNPLTYVIVTRPAHGSLVHDPAFPNDPSKFLYTPVADYNGTDSFTYKVNDGTATYTATDTTATSAAATVSLTINAVNDAPVATTTRVVNILQNTARTVTLGALNVDKDTLSYTILTRPAKGTLSCTGAACTYTPAANDFGTYSFSYKVSDGTLDSQPAIVTFEVVKPAAAPVMMAAQTGTTGESLSFTVPNAAAYTFDAFDGESLPAGAHYDAANGQFTWTPTYNQAGVHVLQFVKDQQTYQTLLAVSYVPPIGISNPEFGIMETYRMYDDIAKRNTALTYYRNDEGGFYTHYIDNGAGCSDSGNSAGTAASPRCTIPSELPAGAVIELHGGPYTNITSWQNAVNGAGTQDKPIFIRGNGVRIDARLSIYTRPTEENSYVIAEGLNAYAVNIGAPSNHVVLRNSDVHGDASGGGVSLQRPTESTKANPNNAISNVTLYNNTIHDNGIWQPELAEGDRDIHGLVIGWFSLVDHVWVLDNDIYHNEGDSIQVNAGPHVTPSNVNNIYIGRNEMHDDKQSALGVKSAKDVIISENDMYGIRVSSSASGDCTGNSDDGPESVWWLYNKIHDGALGFKFSGSAVGTYGMIGNLIYDIHGAGGPLSGDYSQSGQAMTDWHGNIIKYIVNNTIYDTDYGYSVWQGGRPNNESLTLVNNIGVTTLTGYAASSILHSDAINLSDNITGSSALFANVPAFSTRLDDFQFTATAGQMRSAEGGTKTMLTVPGADFTALGVKAGDRLDLGAARTDQNGKKIMNPAVSVYSSTWMYIESVNGDTITLKDNVWLWDSNAVKFSIYYYPYPKVNTNELYLDDVSKFSVGDVIEYNHDGVARRVVSVDTNVISDSIGPKGRIVLDSPVPKLISQASITNWGPKTDNNLVWDLSLKAGSAAIGKAESLQTITAMDHSGNPVLDGAGKPVSLAAYFNTLYGIQLPANPDLGGSDYTDAGVPAVSYYVGNDYTADSTHFTTVQAAQSRIAADIAAHAGDPSWIQPAYTVLIKAGVYQNVAGNCSGATCNLVNVTVSGTASAPITFKPLGDGPVVFRGFGFEDRDLNGDGMADGPADPNKRETLMRISGNYIHVEGLEFTNSQQGGLVIEGSFNRIENVSSHDNWTIGISIGDAGNRRVEGNVVTGCEAYNNRHYVGIAINFAQQTNWNPDWLVTKNIIENSLSYRNGYLPDGTKVLPIGGDPQGGGNSDGIMATKFCASGKTQNACPDNIFRGNIVWSNADDGIDVSFSDSLIENNISFDNGPSGSMGFKVFFENVKNSFVGNIAYANDGNGFDLRSTTTGIFLNNLALNNGAWGFSGGNFETNHNNMAYGSVLNADMSIPAACANSTCSNNWNGKGSGPLSGDPKLANTTLFKGSNGQIVFSLPAGTIDQKVAWLKGQFATAFSLQSGSGAINAGVAASYTDPITGETLSRTVLGSAPEIGAYEYTDGTTPPPDQTVPVISAVLSSSVTVNGAVISWTTNEASDSQLQYRVQGTTTWSNTTLNTSLVTSHSVTLSGLNARTVYEYQVKSKDQAGNLATQATISNFTTLTPPPTGAIPLSGGRTADYVSAADSSILNKLTVYDAQGVVQAVSYIPRAYVDLDHDEVTVVSGQVRITRHYKNRTTVDVFDQFGVLLTLDSQGNIQSGKIVNSVSATISGVQQTRYSTVATVNYQNQLPVSVVKAATDSVTVAYAPGTSNVTGYTYKNAAGAILAEAVPVAGGLFRVNAPALGIVLEQVKIQSAADAYRLMAKLASTMKRLADYKTELVQAYGFLYGTATATEMGNQILLPTTVSSLVTTPDDLNLSLTGAVGSTYALNYCTMNDLNTTTSACSEMKVTPPSGALIGVSLTFDIQRRLITQVFANGNVRTFHYNAQGVYDAYSETDTAGNGTTYVQNGVFAPGGRVLGEVVNGENVFYVGFADKGFAADKIQAAIDLAPAGAVILLAVGTYVNGFNLNAGTKELTIRGDGAVVIDGSTGAERFASVLSGGQLHLEHLTFRHFNIHPYASGTSVNPAGKGILYVGEGSRLTVDGVTFENDQMSAAGGLIYAVGGLTAAKLADVTITNSTFQNNTLISAAGAAMPASTITNTEVVGGKNMFTFTTVAGCTYDIQNSTDLVHWTTITGPVTATGDLSVATAATTTPSGFFRVRTLTGQGGGSNAAVQAFQANVHISGSLFENNQVGAGAGAVSMSGLQGGFNGVIENTVFRNNSATSQYGAGGVMALSGNITIAGCDFIGNTATEGYGGAIRLGGAQATLDHNLFVGNKALYGGAIQTTSAGSSFSSGSFYAPETREVHISFSTVADNVSLAGGGVIDSRDWINPVNGQRMTVAKSIFSDAGQSDITGDPQATLTITDALRTGTDPLFIDAANGDYRIRPNSPAQSQVNNSAVAWGSEGFGPAIQYLLAPVDPASIPVLTNQTSLSISFQLRPVSAINQLTLKQVTSNAAPFTFTISVSLLHEGLNSGLKAVLDNEYGHFEYVLPDIIRDTTPPVLAVLPPSNATQSAVTINWTTTNEASDSQVQYRVQGQGTTAWSNTTLNTSLVTSHSVTFSGLSANTVYEYQVKSKDQAGNLATQTTISNFTTPAPPETPAVSIIAQHNYENVPERGTVGGGICIIADVTKIAGVITSVDFYMDGVLGWTQNVNFYWPFYSEGKPNGTHIFTAKAKDKDGNIISTSLPITINIQNAPDKTPPTFTFASELANNPIITGRTYVYGTGRDPLVEGATTSGFAGIQYRVENSHGEVTFLGDETVAPAYCALLDPASDPAHLANGDYTLFAVARDAANNTYETSVPITINYTGPIVPPDPPAISAQPVGGSVALGDSLTLTVVASVPAGSTLLFQWQKDGANVGEPTMGDATSSSSYTISSAAPADAGRYRCIIKRMNGTELSEVTSSEALVSIPDHEAPRKPTWLDLSPISNPISNLTSTSVTLSWNATTDNIGVTGYQIFKNSVLLATVAGNVTTYTAKGLAPSTDYIFTVKAKDAASNYSDPSDPLTVRTAPDTQAPSAPAGLHYSKLKRETVTLSWSASTDDIGVTGYQIFENGTFLADVLSGTTYSVTGLTASTTYTFTVRAKDLAANASAFCTPVTFTTKSLTDDVADPVISIGLPSVTSAVATINWTTDEASDSQVEYRVKGTTAWMPTSTDPSLVTSHSVALTGLTAGVIYEYHVKSSDASGNLADSLDTQATPSILTTPSPSFGLDPVISAQPVGGQIQNGNDMTLGVAASVPAGSTVAYQWQKDGVDINGATNSSYLLSGASPALAGSYRCIVKRMSGTTVLSQVPSAAAAVTVSPLYPLIYGIAVAAKAASATITWGTSTASDSKVMYRAQGASAWETATSSDSLVKNHSVMLTGLMAGTLYEYRVNSTDSAYRSADEMKPAAFTTAPSASSTDTIVPTLKVASENINGTVTDIVKLSAYSNDADAPSIRFQLDGNNLTIGTPTNNTFDWDTTQTTNGAHVISAIATDSAGNTTTMFFNLRVMNYPIYSVYLERNATDVTVNWKTLSNSNTQVEYVRVEDNGSVSAIVSSQVPDDNTPTREHSIMLKGLEPGATYYYRVKSTNDAGTEVSSDYMFTTAQLPTTDAPQISSEGATPVSLEKDMTWVFAGDSITSLHEYNVYMEAYYQLRYPGMDFHFREAAGSGQQIIGFTNYGRYDYWAYSWDPDIVSASICNGPAVRDLVRGQLDDLAHNFIEGESGAIPVIFGTIPAPSGLSNWANEVFNDAYTSFAKDNGYLYTDDFGPLNDLWTANRNSANPIPFEEATPDHPGPTPQASIAYERLSQLGADPLVSSATINAAATGTATDPVVTAHNKTTIDDKSIYVSPGKDLIEFTRLDDRLPMAIPTDKSLLLQPDIVKLNQYMLQVNGLQAGTYKVYIDGQESATVTSGQLANGWNMAAMAMTQGPIHDQLQRVLDAIYAKEGLGPNPNTVPQTYGVQLHTGVNNFQNYASLYYSQGYRGEDLKAKLAPQIAALEALDQAIYDAAKPVERTFRLVRIS